MFFRCRNLSHSLRGPLAAYREAVATGRILEDARQAKAAERLDRVFLRLVAGSRASPGWTLGTKARVVANEATPSTSNQSEVDLYTRKLAAENRRLMVAKGITVRLTQAEIDYGHKYASGEDPSAPRPAKEVESHAPEGPQEDAVRMRRNSLYLCGSVGRGKTLLMNEFYQLLAEGSLSGLRHRRCHFFEFMHDVHQRMHKVDRKGHRGFTPVDAVANQIADEADVICLDEVTVVDVQDAAIFPRILQIMSLRGVTMVMTSNSRPNSLYLHGLNRHVYIPPLLRTLEQTCRVVDLDDTGTTPQVDYRLLSQSSSSMWTSARYLSPRTPEMVSIFEEEWRKAAGELDRDWELPLPHSATRSLVGGLCKKLDGTVTAVRFDARVLCGLEYSESDYIALANWITVHDATLFIDEVPLFGPLDGLGLGRRFGKLVEVLYDKRVRARILAHGSPQDVFGAVADTANDDLVTVTAEQGMSLASGGALLEASTGAINRATSRLSEISQDLASGTRESRSV